jgi:aspartyl protease family protein
MSGLDPGAQARVFYLLILGLALLAWVFGAYRGRLGQAAQHLAIWGLIFAGVVIAYGFSGQLREQLSPSSLVAVSDDSVVLRRGRDGHFHARIEVNGVPVDFLVDTGASAIVLSQRDAARVGLHPGRLTFSTPATTANGVIYSAPVILGEMRLGPFTDREVGATVNGGALDTSLLGMRYLDRFARFSVAGDRMTLSR